MNLKNLFFQYVTLRSDKHEFLVDKFNEFKTKRAETPFSVINYNMDKDKFWKLISQNDGYEEFAQWARTLLILPVYVPKFFQEIWFQELENFEGTNDQLQLRKFLYMNDLWFFYKNA